MLKVLALATSCFLLSCPLHATEEEAESLASQPQLTKGLSLLDNQLSTECNRPCFPKIIRNGTVFLYASTPLDYGGQDIGVAPVESGTTVAVQFPEIGDQSRLVGIEPAEENSAFIAKVCGSYLINWTVSVKNSNVDPGRGTNLGTAFEVVIVRDGIPQPPNPDIRILVSGGGNPTSQALSGSIILNLKKGSKVQLNITSLSLVPTIPIPLIVDTASINFVRIPLF